MFKRTLKSIRTGKHCSRRPLYRERVAAVQDPLPIFDCVRPYLRLHQLPRPRPVYLNRKAVAKKRAGAAAEEKAVSLLPSVSSVEDLVILLAIAKQTLIWLSNTRENAKHKVFHLSSPKNFRRPPFPLDLNLPHRRSVSRLQLTQHYRPRSVPRFRLSLRLPLPRHGCLKTQTSP